MTLIQEQVVGWIVCEWRTLLVNTLTSKQTGRYFADEFFKFIFNVHTGDKLCSESIITRYTDPYIRHPASMYLFDTYRIMQQLSSNEKISSLGHYLAPHPLSLA